MPSSVRRRKLNVRTVLCSGVVAILAGCVPATVQYAPATAYRLEPGRIANIEVAAAATWRDTGIEVRRDEVYKVGAGGSWTIWGACPRVGAGGLKTENLFCMKGIWTNAYAMPSAPLASLLGRIGENGAPFLIGDTRGFIAQSDGRLYLGINEINGHHGDNVGALQVMIEPHMGAPASGAPSGRMTVAEAQRLIGDFIGKYKTMDVARINAAVAALDEAVENGSARSLPELVKLREYRGRGRGLLAHKRYADKAAPDIGDVQKILADYDFVIANGDDFRRGDAQYHAVIIAKRYLKSDPLAFSYLSACAEAKHAGCMNIMASALERGDYGQSRDIGKSLQWHMRVYETGIRYLCAGSFSAGAMALLGHFYPEHVTFGDPLYWIGESHHLKAEVEREENGRLNCSRWNTFVTEYLLNLSKGGGDKARLRQGLAYAKDPEDRSLILYLLGEGSEDDVRKALADERSGTRCSVQFTMAWHARASGDVARFTAYRHLIDAGDPDDCSRYQALVARLG